jgi:hypothetical protein
MPGNRLTNSVLTFQADLDQVDALAPEREALWARLEKSSFLTEAEKRLAVGYPAMPDAFAKFRPDQPRADNGQWVEDGGGDVHPVQGRPGRGRGRLPSSPAQETRLALADARAKIALRQVAERDPDWRATPSVTDPNSIEGAISAREATAQQAEARLAELLRGSIPGINPDWGVRRIENELRQRGFVFENTTDAPGKLYKNPITLEEVRIIERPSRSPFRTESLQKYLNDYYYRYRARTGQPEGPHITIPTKQTRN